MTMSFLLMILVSFIDLSLQAQWSYDYETQWPGICRTGQQQSPINIMTRSAVEDIHQQHIRGPLVYEGYDVVKVQGQNNGHTLKWSGRPGGNVPPVLSGGPLTGNYTFLQFHLHWLSEHAIDGLNFTPLIPEGVGSGNDASTRQIIFYLVPMVAEPIAMHQTQFCQSSISVTHNLRKDFRKIIGCSPLDHQRRIIFIYPLEIHMVHVKTGVPIEEAITRSDGLAVIGIFGLVSGALSANSALEDIMSGVPYLSGAENTTENFDIDLWKLMSPDPQSYYTYQGSLTTPMCQEVVTWIVMDKPIYISDEQYKKFYNVDVGGSYNYRSLQPANRVVYRAIASCSSILAPSLSGTLIALLSCLSSTVISGISKSFCNLMNAKRKLFGHAIKQCSKFN